MCAGGTFGSKSPSGESPTVVDFTLLADERRKFAHEKMLTGLRSIEQKRVNSLFANRLIGRPTNCPIDVDYHINLRRVNFRWQRGIKIGKFILHVMQTIVVTASSS
jgi:hypothetical protein